MTFQTAVSKHSMELLPQTPTTETHPLELIFSKVRRFKSSFQNYHNSWNAISAKISLGDAADSFTQTCQGSKTQASTALADRKQCS